MQNQINMLRRLFSKPLRLVIVGLAITSTALFFQNCAPVGFSEQGLSSQIAEGNNCAGPSCQETPANSLNCIFNGKVIEEGSSVAAFLNSSVPFGEACTQENRTCRKGTLSGSYNYATCATGTAASCLFDGRTIQDGEIVKAYQASTASAGEECREEYRKCSNGALSGSYKFSNCSVNSPASCLFNGQTILNGQSVQAFQTSTVSFGESCVKQVRTCNNGVLSGSYVFSNCSASASASCLFNGQTIAHGQTVTAYFASSASYGSICQSEVRTCNNGILSGTAPYPSCSLRYYPTLVPLVCDVNPSFGSIEAQQQVFNVFKGKLLRCPQVAGLKFWMNIYLSDPKYQVPGALEREILIAAQIQEAEFFKTLCRSGDTYITNTNFCSMN